MPSKFQPGFFLVVSSLFFVVGCQKPQATSQRGPQSGAEKKGSEAQDQPKGSIHYEVTAEELAKAFEKPGPAKKKYDPNPPVPGGQGGAMLTVKGDLEKAKGKDLHLKTNSDIAVVLRAKSVKGETEGRKAVTGTNGKFKEYRNKTVLVECEEAELTQIIGGK